MSVISFSHKGALMGASALVLACSSIAWAAPPASGRMLRFAPSGAMVCELHLKGANLSAFHGERAQNYLSPSQVRWAFLRRFYSRSSHIVDVEVSGRDLLVYVERGYEQRGADGLPIAFWGFRIVTVGTEYVRPDARQHLERDLALAAGRGPSELFQRHWGEDFIEPPVVLVTGASSGIGLELARLLRSTGYRVVVTARSQSLSILEREGFTDGPNMLVRPLDVMSPDQRVELISEINARWGGVDVLINNAGVAYRSVTEHMSSGELEHQMNVNFLGPIELARAVIPTMRFKGRGRIINVSSMSGIMGMPTMGSYSASKFALEGAMESLYYEMRPFGVAVTLVQPGFVNSDSHTRVLYSSQARNSEKDPHSDYHAYYANIAPFVARLMSLSPSSANAVARTVIRTFEANHPPLRVNATLDAHFFSALRRLLPERAYVNLMYYTLPRIWSWGVPPRSDD